MRLNLDIKKPIKTFKQDSITPEKGEDKKRTIELIKKDMEVPYEFTQTLHMGNAMVHRMRVELSRFRSQIRRNYPGKVIRHFKVIAEVISDTKNRKDIIKMWKTQGGHEKVSNELEMIFKELVLDTKDKDENNE